MVSYQNPITPYTQQTPVQQPQQNQNPYMQWVQGESGAKACFVPSGATVPLWDSENQVIYLKTISPQGIPAPLTILEYTMRPPEVADQGTNYVTKEELDSKFNEILSLLKSNNRPYQKKGGKNNGQSTV